jgi:restriction system protein
MAFKQVIIRRVGPLFWLLGVAETVMSIMSFIKGWFGEAQGAFAQWAFLDQSIYTSLNNITIPTSNGTTQIDHIIVSRHGIFVVEAKNIEGWIFGEKKQKQWVVVRFGRKFRIQNPLHQNYRHTSAIIEFLGIDTAKVQSMVMFWGNCEFKTEMPTNVINSGYIHYIKSFSAVVFTDTEVSCIIRALKVGALPKSWATHEAHLASLHTRHSSTTTCPKCGSPLKLRTTRSNINPGRKFYGCSAFPKCRFTRPCESNT